MTELDAAMLAEQDAGRVHRHISVGAMPHEVGSLVMKTLVARIDGFNVPRASDSARKAARARLTAPTFAENLLSRCRMVTHAAVRHLVPEDARALIIWLVGRDMDDMGFLHPVVEMLSESGGPPALEQLAIDFLAVMTKMNDADKMLFQEHIKVLNPTRRSIIRGFRMDAHWSLSEGDGIGVRDLLVQARQMALKWLKQDQAAIEAGFEPDPEPYW